jgi:SAM-dependent methyltransferase
MTGAPLPFAGRAAYYAAYRPAYPDEVFSYLVERTGLAAGAIVVDLGSGTGLSTGFFLRHGCQVYAVEPDPAMRCAAEARLGTESGFLSIAGSAEATGLPSGAADLAVCASAFHWIDAAAAGPEFRRILKDGAPVAVLRSGRRTGSLFMQGYAQIFRRYAIRTHARKERIGTVRDFFAGGSYTTGMIPFDETLGLEALRGRLLSYSTIPLPGADGHQEMMDSLERLFRRHARAGTVSYMGEITVHLGYFGAQPQSPESSIG